MAIDTNWQPADTDNNVLRKILTRLNDEITVGGIQVGDITIETPLGVYPSPAGSVWKVEANATLPVAGTVAVSNLPVTQPVSGTVAVSNFPATQPVSFSQPITATVTPSGTGIMPVTLASTPDIAFSQSATDAFSRLRVAVPSYVFDSQLTYKIPTIVFENIATGSGASVAHDATNRCALHTFSNSPTGSKAYLQTYEHFRYQPGRSQEIFITFNFIEKVANVLKFAGYSDGVNGIELQQDGTNVQLALLSDTGNGDQIVQKADWNLDPLDGNGPSGINLDMTKTQILVIDFQALYVGRVRVGFDIAGAIVPVHQFTHANVVALPYIQTANLPIRCGMTCTGTVSTTMRYICSSVCSNGGETETTGYTNFAEGTVTAVNGVRTHILSVRPKTTFFNGTNRMKFVLDTIDLVVTGNSPIKWELCIGQAISGTTGYNDVNANHSAYEYNTLGTASGDPYYVIQAGYLAASGNTKLSSTTRYNNKLPITLDAAGAVRANGTMTVLVTGLGGNSACRCILNWRELR